MRDFLNIQLSALNKLFRDFSLTTDLLPGDAVFPHSCTKSAGVQTKDSGCSALPFNAPTGFLENLEDVVLFQFGKGFDVPPCRLLRLRGHVEPIQDLKRAPLADYYCPLHDTFKLPHVARPVVFLKEIQGILCHGRYLLADFLVEFGDKMIDEQRDVILALPEWRQRD